MNNNIKIYDLNSGWEWETSTTDLDEALSEVISEQYHDMVKFNNSKVRFVKECNSMFEPVRLYEIIGEEKRNLSDYLDFMAYTGELSKDNKTNINCQVLF